jgi:hypothetical protein
VAGSSSRGEEFWKVKLNASQPRESEATNTLGLCLRTIDNIIGAKDVSARRIGRRISIPATALNALMGISHKANGKTERIPSTQAEALGLSPCSIDNRTAAAENTRGRKRKTRCQ